MISGASNSVSLVNNVEILSFYLYNRKNLLKTHVDLNNAFWDRGEAQNCLRIWTTHTHTHAHTHITFRIWQHDTRHETERDAHRLAHGQVNEVCVYLSPHRRVTYNIIQHCQVPQSPEYRLAVLLFLFLASSLSLVIFNPHYFIVGV